MQKCEIKKNISKLFGSRKNLLLNLEYLSVCFAANEIELVLSSFIVHLSRKGFAS